MNINPSLTVNENILALINAANPGASKPFTEENVTIGAVSVAGAPSVQVPLNFASVGDAASFILVSGSTTAGSALKLAGIDTIGVKLNREEGGIAIVASVMAQGAVWATVVAALRTITKVEFAVEGVPYSYAIDQSIEPDDASEIRGQVQWYGGMFDSTTLPAQVGSGNASAKLFTGGGGGAGGNNSQVTITAIANQGYSGTKVVKYRRLTITEAAGAKVEDFVTIEPDASAEDITAAITESLGLVADAGLQVQITQDATTLVPGIATIEGLVDSHLYLQGLTSLTIIFPQIALEEAIINGDLDGFVAVAPAIPSFPTIYEAPIGTITGDPDFVTRTIANPSGLTGITELFFSVEEETPGDLQAKVQITGGDRLAVEAFAARIRQLRMMHLFINAAVGTTEVFPGTYIVTVRFDHVAAALGMAPGDMVDSIVKGITA